MSTNPEPTHHVTLVYDHQSYWGETMTLAELGRWITTQTGLGRSITIEVYSDDESEDR